MARLAFLAGRRSLMGPISGVSPPRRGGYHPVEFPDDLWASVLDLHLVRHLPARGPGAGGVDLLGAADPLPQPGRDLPSLGNSPGIPGDESPAARNLVDPGPGPA